MDEVVVKVSRNDTECAIVKNVLTCLAFAAMALLCARYVLHPAVKMLNSPFMWVYVAVAVSIIVFSTYRPFWAAAIFIPCSLFFSELYFIFSGFYLGWVVNRIILRKELSSRDWFETSIDIIIVLSLLSGITAVAIECSLSVIISQYAFTLPTQKESMFSMKYAYFLTHGVMVLRVLLLEIDTRDKWRKSLVLAASYPAAVLLCKVIPGALEVLRPVVISIYWEFTLSTITVAVAVYCIQKSTKWIKITGVVGVLVILGIILYHSSSKTVLIGIILIAAIYALFHQRKMLVMSLTGLCVSIVLILNTWPGNLANNIERSLGFDPAYNEETLVDEIVDLLVIKKEYRWYLDRESYVTNSLAERWDLLQRAFRMIGENPLAGSGAGTFYRLHNYYAGEDDATRLTRPENLHNLYVQMVVEFGLPATILFLGLLAFCFFEAQRKIDAHDYQHIRLALCYGAGFFLLCHLADHPMLLRSYNLFIWVLLAYAATPRQSTDTDPWPLWWRRGMAVILGLIAFGYIWRITAPSSIPLQCIGPS